MISNHLVVVVLAVEAVAIGFGCAVLGGHGVWLAAREQRLMRTLSVARAGLAAGLLRPQAPLPLSLLDGLSLNARLEVLSGLRESVEGRQRDSLRDLARRAGVIEHADRACRSRRWKRRLRGARIHTLLGGGNEAMSRLFDDRRAEVRAEAAVWAAEHQRQGNVERLLTLLGDDATLCRFTVKDSLLRLGSPAVEPLGEFLAGADGQQALDALEVAAALHDPRLLAPASRFLHHADPVIRCHAIAVIGDLGGERGVAALTAALEDESDDVRACAARGLGQGRHWSAAARLAECLRDSSWQVRGEAGAALRRLGPAGELLLRRSLNDGDRFARHMARLMLDRPLPPG